MRTEALTYFVAIAESGSFNKAAETLYISQPSLSRIIHNMEQELNMTLFGRSNHGIQLTEDGKRLYHYSKSVLNQMKTLDDYFAFSSIELPTKLSVSVCGIFLSGMLLNEYYEKNQTARMELLLNEVQLEQVLIHVSTLVSELGVATVYEHQYSHFKRVLDIKGLEAEEISLRLEELFAYPIICLPDDYFSSLRSLSDTEGMPKAKFKRWMTMNNVHSIISLIASSEALYLGNRWGGRDLSNARIHSLPLEENDKTQRLLLIKRKRETLSSAARSFREIFLSHYGE